MNPSCHKNVAEVRFSVSSFDTIKALKVTTRRYLLPLHCVPFGLSRAKVLFYTVKVIARIVHASSSNRKPRTRLSILNPRILQHVSMPSNPNPPLIKTYLTHPNPPYPIIMSHPPSSPLLIPPPQLRLRLSLRPITRRREPPALLPTARQVLLPERFLP